jgi:hypothetical protein
MPLFSISTAIETMMYDSFSVESKPPSPTTSETASESTEHLLDTGLVTASSFQEDPNSTSLTAVSANKDNNDNSKLMSWIKLSSRRETQLKTQDIQMKQKATNSTLDESARLLDSTKLYDSVTKDLHDFIPLLATLPFRQVQGADSQTQVKASLAQSSTNPSMADTNSANTLNKRSPSSTLMAAASGQQKQAEKDR